VTPGQPDLASADWKSQFLTSDQYEVLQSVAEAIVPGSAEAFVARFIDLLLSVSNSAQQDKFSASLTALQGEATRQFGRQFQLLSASQRESLLNALSTSPSNSTNFESFDYLKTLTAGSFYSSEMGMKELGWTPDRFFPRFTGCTRPAEP
jgi:hypothetical protein